MNWLWTMLLGIGGAVAVSWLGTQLGFNTRSGLGSWVAAIGGSLLLLVLYHLATARRVAQGSAATNDDDKRAVFDDLSKGPNG